MTLAVWWSAPADVSRMSVLLRARQWPGRVVLLAKREDNGGARGCPRGSRGTSAGAFRDNATIVSGPTEVGGPKALLATVRANSIDGALEDVAKTLRGWPSASLAVDAVDIYTCRIRSLNGRPTGVLMTPGTRDGHTSRRPRRRLLGRRWSPIDASTDSNWRRAGVRRASRASRSGSSRCGCAAGRRGYPGGRFGTIFERA